MKNVLLTTAAVALMLGFATSAKAAGSEKGSLRAYLDFDSTVEFEQTKDLYLGRYYVNDLYDNPGAYIRVDADGNFNSDIPELLKGEAGQMRLYDPAKEAVTNFDHIEINGDVIKDDPANYTALTTPIDLEQAGTVKCGEIKSFALKDNGDQGTYRDFNFGAEFMIDAAPDTLDKNDVCEANVGVTVFFK